MAASTSLNLSLLRINTLVARYLFFRSGKYVDYIAGATNNVSISLLPVHVRVQGIRSCLESDVSSTVNARSLSEHFFFRSD